LEESPWIHLGMVKSDTGTQVSFQHVGPEISVVAPAHNQRNNVRRLVEAIGAALHDVSWELILVDDDCPGSTADEAVRLAREGFPIRCIR